VGERHLLHRRDLVGERPWLLKRTTVRLRPDVLILPPGAEGVSHRLRLMSAGCCDRRRPAGHEILSCPIRRGLARDTEPTCQSS
jgi:hypothetical protein